MSLPVVPPREPGYGHLVLIGGGEDRSDAMRVLKATWAINDAQTIAVIPSASRYSVEAGRIYTRAFTKLGAKAIFVCDARNCDEAADPKMVEQVRMADMIFFSGGDQVRLAEILNGSPLLAAVRERFAQGATVAGTSAGAAAASDPMLYDGDAYGFHKGSVGFAPGFNLLPGVAIDTHFVGRGRLPRMAQFLASKRCRLGIGLPEDTGIFIAPDGTTRVVGTGVVTLLDARAMDFSDYDLIDDDDNYTVEGLRLGFLAEGAVFDLKTWTVTSSRVKPAAPSAPVQ